MLTRRQSRGRTGRAVGNRRSARDDGPPEVGPAGGPTVLRMLLGRPAAPAPRGQRGHPGGRRLGDPLVRVEDQPDGARPGRLQGARRRRPAHPLRRRPTTTERDALLALAREANTPGWWHRYGDVLPTWFQSYLGLEAAAALIRTYEVQFVPGLLQTAEYARAVVLLGHRAARGRGDRAPGRPADGPPAAAHPRRTPPQLWAVIDEAALRRPDRRRRA